jgi:hypothetical protein
MVNITNHGKPDITIMVWGCIWLGGRSPLVIMERDPESRDNGYSTQSYLATLEEGFIDSYKPGRFFQQDNARIHTSREAQEWFEARGIWVIDWPAHSLYMNPIEYVWRAMKAILCRNHPEVYLLKNHQVDVEILKGWIVDAWEAVPQDLIETLILSMPRRLTALRKAKGWYTKH